MQTSTDGLYLGLISGTSLDGVDAALIERNGPRAQLVKAATMPYPPVLREKLQALASGRGDIISLYRCDIEVGNLFADAANALLEAAGVPRGTVRAIGSHGQTVWHQPRDHFSAQIGDGARIAQRSGIVTVCDFRRADLAAGGEGAPLAPTFHQAMFAEYAPLAILNLGGIANLTLLLPGEPTRAFDVGPANTLLDALARETTGEGCDRGGSLAAQGAVDTALLEMLMADPWFELPPPKSTGPEYFHLDWVRQHRRAGELPPPDLAATLTSLTANSVAAAVERHAAGAQSLLACGGGVHNPQLMQRLREALPGIRVEDTSTHGIDPDFMEAMCFAWLAGETLSGRPGNLPSVTGAREAVVLGAVHYP